VNFDYTPDQRLLKNEARKFLAARCATPVVRGVLDDPGRSHDASLWSQIADMGWLGSVVPEEHGGLGLGHVELCVIAEELGRALAPVPFASTVYFFAQALMLGGSHAQRAAWLAPLSQGKVIGCFAAAEGAGEALPPVPRVQATDGRLYGDKIPVVDGGIADAAIVLACEGPDASLFLVHLRGDGVERAALASLDPSRDLARVSFSGAAADRLGPRGQGLALARQVLDRAASLLAFEQLGGADRCLEMATSYALERHAFGRPIASYQAIKHKLADIFVRNQLARSNAYHAAWALDDGGDALPLAAATARIAACDAYWHASKENIQIHGGMGFTWEVDAHLYYRRAQQLALAAGAPHYWKERLVSRLERRQG
jgi:alkylation response protein AidB-like acyl-CoA dehydrogenase